MDELTSNANIGVSLEAALQESRNQTILLSDIRDNSEARNKADEKTYEQLKKLAQASTQSLEVAKEQKQQHKDSSNTLRTMQEATNNANAIVAKRQISTLNLLNNTINTGLNVVNQKMFIVLESLGNSLANAFSSVGRSLENKLYALTGSFSILLKPLVGAVKVGFEVMTKLISVPLKMIWEGLKAFSDTIIGKLVLFGTTLFLAHQFFTKTDIGQRIGAWIESKKNDPSSYIGKMFTTVDVIVSTIKWAVGALIVAQTLSAASSAVSLGKTLGAGGAFKSLLAKVGLGGGAAMAAKTLASKPTAATSLPINKYVWDGTKPTAAASTAAAAPKMSKLASIGSKIGGKTSIGGLLGGFALDYAADNVENDKLSGGLHLGSAALSGASTGAMIGTMLGLPGPGTAIGAILGAGLGIGGSLLFGEGGKKLFGNDEAEQNEVQQLEQMQKQQSQATNAEVHALESIAEAIRDNNKILTKVAEKQNIDAQPELHRHEATTNEQNRHADAQVTNDKLQKILEQFSSLSTAFSTLAASITNAVAKDNPSVALGIASNIGKYP